MSPENNSSRKFYLLTCPSFDRWCEAVILLRTQIWLQMPKNISEFTTWREVNEVKHLPVYQKWKEMPVLNAFNTQIFYCIFLHDICRKSTILLFLKLELCKINGTCRNIHFAFCRDKFLYRLIFPYHYDDVIMTTTASQITSLTIVYSTVYSDADQGKHQSSASLAFVWGIHRDRWIPRTKGQLRGKCFHLMTSSCNIGNVTGTGTTLRLPQCQWCIPDEYE